MSQIVSFLFFGLDLCVGLSVGIQCLRLAFRLSTCWRERSQALWIEFPNSLLVELVIWILLCSDELGEPCRSLEKDEIRDSTNRCPIPQTACNQTAPLIQYHPESLFCGKVWMARVSPQSLCKEATIEVCLLELGWDFGSRLVLLLCILVVPLLLIGDG